MEYRIGDFSLVSRIPTKTLRYYHEVGLLEPARIDEQSGYRLYDREQLATARLIRHLRGLEFPVSAVRDILDRLASGEEITSIVAAHGESVRRRVTDLLAVEAHLAELGTRAGRGAATEPASAESLLGGSNETQRSPRAGAVSRRRLEPELCATIRFTGAYHEVGAWFAALARRAGDIASGIPMALYWQDEYHEDDADISVAFPVARPVDREGIDLLLLPAVEAVTSVYKGPYEGIGVGYERVLAEVDAESGVIALPIRERYIRGPGMDESPDPDEYLTEVVVPLAGE